MNSNQNLSPSFESREQIGDNSPAIHLDAASLRRLRCSFSPLGLCRCFLLKQRLLHLVLTSRSCSQGDVFAYLSSTGNYDIILAEDFKRASEMQDERVDLMMDMIRRKYDWSKHEWAFQETVEPFVDGSEEDGSDKEEAGETSETGMEEEIETTPVSATTKKKKKFQDAGTESRKKRLFFQISAEKYRDIEEEMKSYIQVMFKSSFTALALEVRNMIGDRVAKLEEKLLSSQNQGGAPAYTQSHGDVPTFTQTYGPVPASGHASASTHDPASDSNRAPPPTVMSARTSAPAPIPKRSQASAPSLTQGLTPSHTGGPANAAKTRSQTKDANLSDVFGSLFSILDANLGTQEHLQKIMGNLSQESNVDGFDPSQDKQSKEPFAFIKPETSFRPEIFKRPFLTDIDDPEVRCKDSDYELIGPSKFDAELASRIMEPNIWLKNYDMDAMMYLFREKTSLRRWKPDRVAFMNCMFSNHIITAYGKFDGNRRGYKIDDSFLYRGSVWYVDVDRLYIPICINQIHWISMCVNLVNRTGDVFDCGGKKNNKAVEAFAVLIPRIVKVVQPSDKKKDFNVKQYTVSYVPMSGVNMSGNDCSVYSLKFIECHLLGLDFSLVNDENIKEVRHKIVYDLWEAANDEVLKYQMSTFKPPKRAPGKAVDLG
ncbi:hypothetical protein Bca52824_033548 [Brassica carinata]|uniref:Ubiquitin-like protease family profile domain-containing protein n=1 Tax=Brassica carinata TaxID=52824 RepID=A0A8X7SEJ4_BRACI|nr:hypothetical protein Bca52824_033548 [Brassica carinata]